MRKLYSLAAAALMGAAVCQAMPAKPGLHPMTMPDGTTMMVQNVGDEYFHYYVSSDGYAMMLGSDGLMRYADLGADGVARATDVVATASRTGAAERQLLSTLKPEAVRQALAAQGAKARAAKLSARNSLMKAPTANYPYGLMPGAAFPLQGSPKALVILVTFNDNFFHSKDPKAYFSSILNDPGCDKQGATGSARDFFSASSYGKFTPEFDVYGPVNLDHPTSWYGGNDGSGNDRRPWEMVWDACDALDATVDFSQYDTNGDGYIDNVYVFYAGPGENDYGPDWTVWPHSFNITQLPSEDAIKYYDGVRLDRYACSNEWQSTERPDGIGTFVHEFGHVMGLPDEYSTYDMANHSTPYTWSAMDYGGYNNDSRTPPQYCAFQRFACGWLHPEEINQATEGSLRTIDTGDAYIIPTPKATEYFMLENRQQTGWDQYVPGHGMLVWHIDYNQETWTANTVNNDKMHYGIDIEEADGKSAEDQRAGDTFPGTTGATSFTDNTSPSMRTWDGTGLNLPITDICEDNGVITFMVAGGTGAPARPGASVDQTCADGFHLVWEPVARAEGYKLTVRLDGTPVAGYDSRNLAEATDVDVKGLQPGKTYTATVRAYNDHGDGTECSPLTVTTLADEFQNRAVHALAATDINVSGFTANWEPVKDADSYELTIYTLQPGSPYEDVNDFNNGADDLKGGWESTSPWTSNGDYAASGLAWRLYAKDDNLTTPTYEDGIRGITFWNICYGSVPETATLLLSAYDGTTWKEVRSYPVSKTAQVITDNDIPEGTVRLRLTNKGSIYTAMCIDDFAVRHGAKMEMASVPGYDWRSVAAATSHVVTGLESGTEYRYVVRAAQGNARSLSSAPVLVVPGKSTVVENMAAQSSSEPVYYDLMGRRVARPQGGVFVRVQDGKATKVVK